MRREPILSILISVAIDAVQSAFQQISEYLRKHRRTVVCLCGSTRFAEAYQKANLQETLAGKVVLTIGCDMKSDGDLFENLTEEARAKIKADLDALHFDKIEWADEILVLNVDGYIGDSTRREIEHAKRLGKRIRYWDENPVVAAAKPEE